jgi:hypothetical protein
MDVINDLRIESQTSNGRWAACVAETAETLIGLAVETNKKSSLTREGVIAKLMAGDHVRFDTDWHSVIRSGAAHEEEMKRLRAEQPPVKMVRCSCGHTVPSSSVMSASLGSSCPDCYDRMSDY